MPHHDMLWFTLQAWEPQYAQLVASLRAGELRHVRRASVFRALNTAFFFVIQPLMCAVTFGVFWARGGVLSPSLVFCVVSLLNIVQLSMGVFFPMAIEGAPAPAPAPTTPCCPPSRRVAFPNSSALLQERELRDQPRLRGSPRLRFALRAAAGLAELRVSLRRLHEVLELPEVAPHGLTTPAPAPAPQAPRHVEAEESQPAVELRGVSCAWQQQPAAAAAAAHSRKAPLCLRDVSLRVARGELIAVVGAVGSGKTSLLMAVLRELQPLLPAEQPAGPAAASHGASGLAVRGRCAYAAQHAFVVSGSLRTNVTFGRSFDAPRFRAVVRACQLDADVANMARAVNPSPSPYFVLGLPHVMHIESKTQALIPCEENITCLLLLTLAGQRRAHGDRRARNHAFGRAARARGLV